MAAPAATGTIHANTQKEELDMGLRERLGKEWLFCDGGTGSILQGMGLEPYPVTSGSKGIHHNKVNYHLIRNYQLHHYDERNCGDY